MLLLCLFRLLQASRIPWLVALLHSDLRLPHRILSFSLTLALLPPSYKDLCDDIEPTWKIQATLPTQRSLTSSLQSLFAFQGNIYKPQGLKHEHLWGLYAASCPPVFFNDLFPLLTSSLLAYLPPSVPPPQPGPRLHNIEGLPQWTLALPKQPLTMKSGSDKGILRLLKI